VFVGGVRLGCWGVVLVVCVCVGVGGGVVLCRCVCVCVCVCVCDLLIFLQHAQCTGGSRSSYEFIVRQSDENRCRAFG